MLPRYLLALFFLALVFAQDDAFAEAEDAADDFGEDLEDDAEDFADDAEDDFDEAADEGLELAGDALDGARDDADALLDGARSDAADVVDAGAAYVPKTLTEAEEIAEEDLWVLLIGIQACFDVLWWLIWGWFVYIETNVSDSTMCVNSDCVVKIVPIAWFWQSTGHTTLSWTALQYLFIWLFYMLISVPEMIFWAMHMAGSPEIGTYLLNIWVKWPGLYGGWILYFFNFLWPIIQMTSLTNISQPGYTNAAVQLAMLTISWLFTGIVHVLGYPFIQRMYDRTQKVEVAAEPAPVVVEEPEEEDEEEEFAEEDDDDSDDAF